MVTASIMDGKKISQEIKDEIKTEVASLAAGGLKPRLDVILVGDDPASVVYAQSKGKVADKLGIEYHLHELGAGTPQEDILQLIAGLNSDPLVHGIMIELPLPPQIDKEKVMEAVDPLKDVDGVHPINRGYILSGQEGLFPATPQSCVEILLRSGVELKGKNAVIVGRGETVGKPLVFLLLKHNPTITICHSRTTDLASHVRQADVVIAAVGKAKMITKEMIKPGAVVVDAGINELPGGGICGDVDFDGASEVAGLITPVPGGVGSLTTALILKNLLKGIALQKKAGRL